VYAPADNAKTATLVVTGGTGERMSLETKAGVSTGFPSCSSTLKATMAPLVTGPFALVGFRSGFSFPQTGANTQSFPSGSFQPASPPQIPPPEAASGAVCDGGVL